MKDIWLSFGPNPSTWLMNADFQYFLYAVMTYPFALLIIREKIQKKRERLHYIYLLSTWMLPLISILSSRYRMRSFIGMHHEIHIKAICEQILDLAFWSICLWILLVMQIYIRKFIIYLFMEKYKTLETVISHLTCFILLYQILKFVLNPKNVLFLPNYNCFIVEYMKLLFLYNR